MGGVIYEVKLIEISELLNRNGGDGGFKNNSHVSDWSDWVDNGTN